MFFYLLITVFVIIIIIIMFIIYKSFTRFNKWNDKLKLYLVSNVKPCYYKDPLPF